MEQLVRRHRTKFEQFNSDGEIFCYSCKTFKPACNYDHNPENWYRNLKDRRCKQEQHKKRRENNRGQKDLNRIFVERIAAAKERVKRSGLEFGIDVQFLHELWSTQEGKCAVSGLQMTYVFAEGRIPTNVSVDRINSLDGYTKENT